MPKYYVEASWHQSGYYIIEAKSLAEARAICENPDRWEKEAPQLETLPPPHQETTNDDWILHDEHTLRLAEPREVRHAESGGIPAQRDKLRAFVESLANSDEVSSTVARLARGILEETK